MSKNRSADTWNRGVFGALVKLMHIIAAVQYIYSIYYDFKYVHPPKNVDFRLHQDDFTGKLKFLTIWDAILQAIYFTICVINDLIGTNDVAPKKMPLIRKMKDYILAAFAFPVALNVGSTFWGIYIIDRELVFPKALDAFFPSWLNHVMHTNIVIFMVIEMCTSFRQYPSRKAGLIGLSIFMGSYLVWLHIINYMAGIWVYPILEVLNFAQRLIFFAGILIFSVCLYMFGEFFNSLIWTKELKQLKSGSKKVK